MPTIKIYSTSHCPSCLLAKNYLAKHNIEFTNFDIEKDEAKRDEMIARSKQLNVPVFDIDGELIIGFKKGEIDRILGIKKPEPQVN